MILGSWGTIKLICGNHGEDISNEMQVHEGSEGMSAFYNCPQYKSIYGKDHSTKSCNNRLSITEYTKMLDFLMNRLMDDSGVENDLTGLQWKMQGTQYKVIEHEGDNIIVSVLNKKAIS